MSECARMQIYRIKVVYNEKINERQEIQSKLQFFFKQIFSADRDRATVF